MNPDPLALPLRDLHLPDPIYWWPLAPGWWLIAATIVLIVLLVWLFSYFRKRGALKKQALKTLLQIEVGYQNGSVSSHESIQTLSVFVRRLMLSRYPRHETASLIGDDWLAQLDTDLAGTTYAEAFSKGEGRVLVEAPYNPNCSIDIPALVQLIRIWVEHSAKRGVAT